MNLGKVHMCSRLRRGWPRRLTVSGFAVVVGVFGLVGVHPAEGRAVAPAAGSSAADAGPFADLPAPPRWAPAVAVEDTTTTTAPMETTTTAPPETTTTTTTVSPPAAPPAPATSGPVKPPAAGPAPPAPASGPAAQARVEAIADSSGWDWRAAGVRFNLAFYPTDCCHWGVYEAAKSVIWVGPTAFADPNRLRYVVLHELSHAWQYRQNRFAQFISDYTTWGFTTIGPALEAGADCLANVWGASGGHYWSCPPAARALAARRFSGDWRA